MAPVVVPLTADESFVDRELLAISREVHEAAAGIV
jgi:hypothetical protein